MGPPRRFSYSAETWASAARDRQGRAWAPNFVALHSSAALDRKPSMVLDEGLDWRDLEGNRHSRWGDSAPSVRTWPTFVIDIRSGRVCDEFGTVLAPDDTLLADVSAQFLQDQQDHSVRDRLWLGRPSSLEGVFGVIAANYGHVYYHWMFDVLPRLELLRLAGYDPTALDGIIVNRLVNPIQVESMRALGITRWLAPPAEGRFHVQADRLIVPSVAGCSGEATPWACQFLRQSFLRSTPAEASKRIYISRGDATSRKVRNEDQLLATLEPLGVEPITLTGRTLAEQAELLASAELVVAPHGGGLTNLVFARPNAAVVELYARSYVNPVFWHLASMVGLRHAAVFATPVPRSRWPTPQSDDLDVDVDAVVASVYKALRHAVPAPGADPSEGPARDGLGLAPRIHLAS